MALDLHIPLQRPRVREHATAWRDADRGRAAELLTERAGAKQGQTKDAIALLKEDHTKVRALLGELEETSEQAASTKVLKDLVEHHAEEEETQMFPRAKKLMDRAELVLLGGELASAKQAMMTGVTRRGS